MAEQFEENENTKETGFTAWGLNRWLLVASVALLVVAGIAMGYGYRQQILADHLTAQQSMANATINEMQGQLNKVTAKLNEGTAAQQAAAQQQAKQAAARANGKTGGGKGTAAASTRLKELQAQTDDKT